MPTCAWPISSYTASSDAVSAVGADAPGAGVDMGLGLAETHFVCLGFGLQNASEKALYWRLVNVMGYGSTPCQALSPAKSLTQPPTGLLVGMKGLGS